MQTFPKFFIRSPLPDIAVHKRSFQGYRLVDLMVAKFGMKPEFAFGLKQSGMQYLLSSGQTIQALCPRIRIIVYKDFPHRCKHRSPECNRATIAFGILISPFSIRLPAASVFDPVRYVDSLSTSGH